MAKRDRKQPLGVASNAAEDISDGTPEADTKPIKFFRIVELPPKAGDTYRGYQGEVVEVLGDQVIARRLVGKPNLFEYAQTDVVDQMDPRNHVEPNKTPFA